MADLGYGSGGVALRIAVRMGDLQTVKRFCKEAADGKDPKLLLEPSGTFREWTALHIASWGALKDPKKAKCAAVRRRAPPPPSAPQLACSALAGHIRRAPRRLTCATRPTQF